MKPTALMILAPGFEELEAIAPLDLLRRGGVDVTVASLGADRLVAGKHDVPVQAEATLAEVASKTYDAIVLPGGPGHRALRESREVLDLIRAQDAAGGWLAAICAAPTVLFEAGLLEGHAYTAHYTVAEELTHIREAEPVVVDGNLITSRGAGTGVAFGLALVAALVSDEAAQEVARSIHEPSTLLATP